MKKSAFLLAAVSALPVFAQGLFTYEGKTYSKTDIPPALQQQIYELDKQHHDGVNDVIANFVVRQYIEAKATKEKKTPEAVELELFAAKVSEADAKKWFEGNKERLGGRSFDSIKADIINFLSSQEKSRLAKELVAKLEKDKKLVFANEEPKAPTLKIATEGFPNLGNPKAKVKIIEFADYRCPHCKHATDVMKKVIAKYKDKVEFHYLDFPLQAAGISNVVSDGGVCADAQKKYWEYHDKAFDRQASLNDQSPVDIAKELKLDMVAFNKCLKDPATQAKVNKARKEGENAGVSGTPTIYINGQKYLKGLDEESLAAHIDSLIKA